MNDIDELPNWAGRALHTGSTPVVPGATPTPTPEKGGGGLRKVLLGLLAIVLLGGVAAAAYFIAGGGGDDDEVATDAATATTAADTAGANAVESAEVEPTDEAASPTTETTAEETTTSEAPAETEGEADSAAEGASDGVVAAPADYVSSDPNYEQRIAENTRYTVVKGGQVYLYGFLPTAELAAQLEAVAGAVVGPDNVFNEQFVDPDTPEANDAPIFVDDRVLFAFNSVAIEPDFLPILDLGILLLTQNPSATVTVIARTDATGSEAVNQRVSEQRAGAVVNYWVGKGIPRERITIDARGESEALDTDDDTTAAINRSVEFRVVNVLGLAE
ncbi:MAG: OmpA family protein [Actinomycetota bacterium]